VRVAEFFAPEDHEIRQRELIRQGSKRLVHAIRTHHPERYVPAPLPLVKAVPHIKAPKPAFMIAPIPDGYTLPPLPMKGREIVTLVAQSMGVGIEAILGRSRVSEVVECRALIATTLRGRGWSFPQIGRLLKRDHSTIINLCDKIDIYCRRSEDCRDAYKALAKQRRGG
jgi:hypothetical protein